MQMPECKTCQHLAEDRHHPLTTGKSISELKGYVCLAPEFWEGNVKIVFSGWTQIGMCEMYDERKSIDENTKN